MEEHDPHAAFRAAVRGLSDEASAANVERYLVASRLLDRAARAKASRAPQRRPARQARR